MYLFLFELIKEITFLFTIYLALTGGKTCISRLEKSEKCRRGTTALIQFSAFLALKGPKSLKGRKERLLLFPGNACRG
jgi:hypothetical protein